MWKTRQLSPSVNSGVIYVTDNARVTYSFPIVQDRLSLKLLKLSFDGACGLHYIDTGGTGKNKKANTTGKVKVKGDHFLEPHGGWFCQNRYYFANKRKAKTRDVLAVEMLNRYKAVTMGVTVYFDELKIEEPKVIEKTIVAAIDFGTSFSGYAYSFKSDPTTIYTNDWMGEGMSHNTEKAPTTVLLYSDKKFHSFGYNAEDEYALLVDGEVFQDWYYFRNFKMKLYQNKDLRRSTMLRDIEGKQVRALDIFTMAIGYLKKCLLKDLKSRDPELSIESIEWVITVPAIWSDAAKQFMREATVNAGIDGESLKLVLEPEAASLFCKTRDPTDMHVVCGKMNGNPLEPGKSYILLDLGGGTADMSAHEILQDGALKEIHRATGDALGGSTVDEAFNKLLVNIFGAETMLEFFHDYRQDYVEFMRDFESKKRLPSDLTTHVVFQFPQTLGDVLMNQTEMTIEEALMKSPHPNNVRVKADKIMLDGIMMYELFKPTVLGIVRYIREMRMDERLAGVDTIVLAGGFSKSGYVRTAIKEQFPDTLIVTPSDPGIAILKGAVLMGHKPETIVERVARYTYGVGFARKPFYEDEDPVELKARRNGETYCDNVFEKLVEIRQPIKWSDVFTVNRTSHLVSERSKKRSLYTKLYASLDKNPEYCTEDCYCVKIGEIVRQPPPNGWPDVMKSKIEIKFGETEMTVEIVEELSRLRYKARIDSL